MAEAPKKKRKQLNVLLSEKATRTLSTATKNRIKASPKANEQAVFFEEFQALINKEGLANIVETLGTSTKFTGNHPSGN